MKHFTITIIVDSTECRVVLSHHRSLQVPHKMRKRASQLIITKAEVVFSRSKGNLCSYQWRIQSLPDGGRQPQRWRQKPIIWPNFSPKIHENERIQCTYVLILGKTLHSSLRFCVSVDPVDILAHCF